MGKRGAGPLELKALEDILHDTRGAPVAQDLDYESRRLGVIVACRS